jgi:hypothetical protein
VRSGGPLAYLGNLIIDPESAQLTVNGMRTYRVRIEEEDTASDCDVRYRWHDEKGLHAAYLLNIRAIDNLARLLIPPAQLALVCSLLPGGSGVG